ncbi:MotA/TolQ/ExbB proton channel family protein [Litchfieldella xinjiangensis]|uniref:MotA/TolQ/ExbB proton channel family protein n=1 Tax=Litchfieldella xinjiangensis TaxID=1166948 RepID=UPI0005B8C26A|nr:MotA/TolQ/ExbB proton channel family protein [Halomonas xinjiangensis]
MRLTSFKMVSGLLLVATVLMAGAPVHAQEQGEPRQGVSPETLRMEREAAESRDLQRLAELADDGEALEGALEAAITERDAARERRQALEARHQALQDDLQALEERRQSQGEGLEGVMSVVTRHSSELRDQLAQSWLTLGGASLPDRVDEQEVLEREHIEHLADRLMALNAESARGVRVTYPVADQGGVVEPREVIRLGDVVAFTERSLLRLDGEGSEQRLAMAERTPSSVARQLEAFHAGQGDRVAFDPTRGQVLDALAQQPSLAERFHQGGAVGYVVVALGLLGLLVALGQYAYLLRVSAALRRQVGNLQQLRDDNPLGRVLGRFRALGTGHAPEALEARLDEALLAEQPRLERGQPLVKLLAAIAPLLGLLGTVTGMIVTFQSITVFGTGDPQLMAGGISQALVTTVLGLITAVPLLFAHTALASRSRHLIGIVEGRASAELAEHLEAQRKTEPRVHDTALA